MRSIYGYGEVVGVQPVGEKGFGVSLSGALQNISVNAAREISPGMIMIIVIALSHQLISTRR